ncbi:luciferin sulfotransferase-like [Schistocerca piceifrons]|uniref:luciferin sulfotransferase-like n=1 Tax=Schistocerca piceifrons TaxID=274613 RepID=UPI001F5FF03B|nr:luciferin sulfotransferase-like [Schistocerca piceifrons]
MEIKNFKVYPDDIWVISYPKSGTTWTQEMVWLIENNLDFVTARRTLQRDRFPFFEVKCALLRDQKTSHPLQMIDCLKRPRFIKSHLPVDLLPAQLWTVKPKIIYVVRNPKDVAISYYYHHRLMHGYRGNIKTFVEIFLSGNVAYGPYWRHVLDFWKLRDEPNVLINSFEDMKKDICSVINKMSLFLGRTLKEDQVTALAHYLSFESMKNNSSVNFHNTGPDNEVIDFILRSVTDRKLFPLAPLVILHPPRYLTHPPTAIRSETKVIKWRRRLHEPFPRQRPRAIKMNGPIAYLAPSAAATSDRRLVGGLPSPAPSDAPYLSRCELGRVELPQRQSTRPPTGSACRDSALQGCDSALRAVPYDIQFAQPPPRNGYRPMFHALVSPSLQHILQSLSLLFIYGNENKT